MNNYSIITLGPSGCGKTIFLASLFKVFSTRGKFGFFLEVQDPMRRIALNKIYADLTVGEQWPSGTKNISEWVFTGYVDTTESSKIPACKITCIDYKGGLLTDVYEEERSDSDFSNLEAYTREADAVLVILDGQKLLAFMQDGNLSNKWVLRWLNEDLPNLMQMVDACHKNTPVHFIISKWDLLEDTYSLSSVRERLSEVVREFDNVVENRRKLRCPVRLIPVSSLGRDFAVLQPDGQMKKLSGHPHPMNVEFPLAFALTDKMQTLGILKKDSFKFSVLDWFVIGICTALVPFWGIGLILAFVYWMTRLLTRRKKNSDRTSAALSSEEALQHILERCREIQKQFHARFPDSDLAKVPTSKGK